MTIIAIIGWLLFACVLTLYIVGVRINARDENHGRLIGLP